MLWLTGTKNRLLLLFESSLPKTDNKTYTTLHKHKLVSNTQFAPAVGFSLTTLLVMSGRRIPDKTARTNRNPLKNRTNQPDKTGQIGRTQLPGSGYCSPDS